MVTPENSFNNVIGQSLQPLMEALNPTQVEAVTATYGTEGGLNHQQLVQDFMAWMQNPQQTAMDPQIEEAFTNIKNEMLDNYGALQGAGAARISPEAHSMFNQLFEQSGRKTVEAPSMVSVVDDAVLTAELEQISKNTTGDNDKLVDAFLKHTNYNFSPFTVGSDIKSIFAAFDKALAPHMEGMLSRQSVQSILDIIMNLDQPEGQRAVRGLIANMAVPASAITRTTARIIDPVARESDTVFNQLYSNIPGFSLKVPERRNFLGEIINAPEAWGSDYFSPLRYSNEDKTDKVYQEISRLGGIDGVAVPGTPQRVWRVKGQTVRLDAEQYSKYMAYSGTQHKINGQTMKERLNRLVNSSLYDHLSDDKKAKRIREVVSEYREQAKQKMMRVDPSIRNLLGLDK